MVEEEGGEMGREEEDQEWAMDWSLESRVCSLRAEWASLRKAGRMEGRLAERRWVRVTLEGSMGRVEGGGEERRRRRRTQWT